METMTLKHKKIKENENKDIASHTLFLEIPLKIGEAMGYKNDQEITRIEFDSLRDMKRWRSLEDNAYWGQIHTQLTT